MSLNDLFADVSCDWRTDIIPPDTMKVRYTFSLAYA